MGILLKHTKPTVSKYFLEGDTTLYLGVDRHPFTMGKVVFFYDVGNMLAFQERQHLSQSPRIYNQVEGYSIMVIEDGFNGTPTLPQPEKWEIQRDINSMCEWYGDQIKGNKSINRKFKIK